MIKNFLINIISLNIIIFNNNQKNYANFIKIYYLNKRKILIFSRYSTKYNWYNVHEDYKNKVNFFYFLNNLKTFTPTKKLLSINPLYDIVKLKRKTSMFKKNSDHNYLILNYINQLKINFEKNNKFPKEKKLKVFKKTNFFLRNVDLSRKLKLMFKNNRKILKSYFNLKYYRNFSLSKNIKQLTKLKGFDILSNLEHNIVNTLMKTDIFISLKDCIWFLDNSLIFLNSKTILNKSYLVKPFDIINVSHSHYYFSFYKNKLNSSINNLYKINLKLWSINKNRSKGSNFRETYPLWMDNYKHYKKDIPLNMEVDYTAMSIIILYIDNKTSSINYLNLKSINIYLNRLYNWKYII